jgi:two-component system, NarL family, invasion response regulator UvrY
VNPRSCRCAARARVQASVQAGVRIRPSWGGHLWLFVPSPFRVQHAGAILVTSEMQKEHRDVHVLIVDDQAAFRRAVRNVVDLTPGFAVAGEADTGEAAVDAARERRPDLVLMDVHLPGIGGPEASRRILANSDAKPPVIFLLSTYHPSEYADGTFLGGCGAKAYLMKAEFGSARLSAAWEAATDTSGTRP